MSDYQLMIRIPFEALDDLEARQKARDMLVVHKAPDKAVVKLQRLRENKEPEGVKL